MSQLSKNILVFHVDFVLHELFQEVGGGGGEVGGSNERCSLTSDFDAKKFMKRSRARF